MSTAGQLHRIVAYAPILVATTTRNSCLRVRGKLPGLQILLEPRASSSPLQQQRVELLKSVGVGPEGTVVEEQALHQTRFCMFP